ncbi:hypothetical protein SBOR_6840 [Sclerotinia borealis F-4128]|uniref:DUF6594 domain-containing protein n=1 Tax=Sclerotinia borealis (strain F-4128) TaxID=1432307 RepID=W9CAF2_SCLBF|nr:hypothetical protein SBOR_6840 [Sclerotinia borealis F-4128]
MSEDLLDIAEIIRSKTPEDRSFYKESNNPSDSIALFDVGNNAWLRVPRQGNFEFAIVVRKQEDGKFVYQVKDPKSGIMYKEGAWFEQEQLSPQYIGRPSWLFTAIVVTLAAFAATSISMLSSGWHISVFLDSDENFKIHRRFGYLHSRLLLRKQDEIRRLEAELDELDDLDEAADAPDKLRARSRVHDIALEKRELADDQTLRTRSMILDEIEEKLSAYDDLLLKSQALNAMHRPTDSDYRSVEQYIFDRKPLVDEEQGFIYEKDDLVILREGREDAFLDTMTEKFLQSLFCTSADRAKTDDPNLHYFSKSRKDTFITTLLVLVLLILLILPVFLLYRLTEHHNINLTYTVSIGVLLVFTLVFSAVLSLFTQAKRHEIFGAAAGYVAVLVVFISNIPNVN